MTAKAHGSANFVRIDASAVVEDGRIERYRSEAHKVLPTDRRRGLYRRRSWV